MHHTRTIPWKKFNLSIMQRQRTTTIRKRRKRRKSAESAEDPLRKGELNGELGFQSWILSLRSCLDERQHLSLDVLSYRHVSRPALSLAAVQVQAQQESFCSDTSTVSSPAHLTPFSFLSTTIQTYQTTIICSLQVFRIDWTHSSGLLDVVVGSHTWQWCVSDSYAYQRGFTKHAFKSL